MLSRVLRAFSATTILLPVLISVAQAQELPPPAIYLGAVLTQDDGTLFDDALYISDFECLVTGKNWQWEPACEYYKAKIFKDNIP